MASRERWKSLLQYGAPRTDAKGKVHYPILAKRVNALTILRHAPEWSGVLAFDEFAGDVIKVKPPPWGSIAAKCDTQSGPWTADDTTRLSLWLEDRYRISLTARELAPTVRVSAQLKRIHPVREYLTKLRWDKKKRIDSWLVRLAGAEDSKYVRAVSSKWLIGLVARVMQPGCQLDSVLVLEGLQNAGKTSTLRILAKCPEWLHESRVPIGDKDAYQVLQRKWIVEFGELESFGRAEISSIKQFITERYSTYRPSYGEKSMDFPRQCGFAGTTNEDQWHKDNTGGRRFWPVRVENIDLRALESERDQLWAEAFARYKRGEKWHLTDAKLITAQQTQTEERRQGDPWEELISVWLSRLTPAKTAAGVSTSEVLGLVIQKEAGQRTRADEMRAATCLRAVGWGHRMRTERHGVRLWRYFQDQKVGQVRQGYGTVVPINFGKIGGTIPSIPTSPIISNSDTGFSVEQPVTGVRPLPTEKRPLR